ncbi:MAG: tetratricopeptide repeat protein [Xanthomonadales bacterium]|nr:tetratricopeptide repeat protein [Xanthomonadales bacterium]
MKTKHTNGLLGLILGALSLLLSASLITASAASAKPQRLQLELLGLSQPLIGFPLVITWQQAHPHKRFSTPLKQQVLRSNEQGQIVLPAVHDAATKLSLAPLESSIAAQHRWLLLEQEVQWPLAPIEPSEIQNPFDAGQAALHTVYLFPSYFVSAIAKDYARLTAADFRYSRFNPAQRLRLIDSLAMEYGFTPTQLQQAYQVMASEGRLIDQAFIYYLQGQWALAAEYFETVRTTTPHLRVEAQYFLALCHYQLHSYAQATELLRPLVALYSEHQSVRDWLGHTYRNHREWALAEDHYVEALNEVRTSSINIDTDAVASRLKNLAALYEDTERYQQAEQLLLQAMQLQRQHYDEHHIIILELRHRLAKVYQGDQRFAQAQAILGQLLEQKRLVLGARHPALADLHHEIALVYEAQQVYDEAVQHLRQALRIDRNYHGEGHPQLAVRMNNLALMLKHHEAFDEAETLLGHAAEIVGRQLGEQHPSFAVALNNHANLIKLRGEYARAEAMMWRVVAIDEEALGVEHPGLAVDLGNLAQLLLLQKRAQEAEVLMHRSLRILLLDSQRRSVLHPQLPDVMNGYVYLLQQRGFSDMEIERRILQVKNEVAASDS